MFRWRLWDGMKGIMILAIYFAAIHSVADRPRGDSLPNIWQGISFILLPFVLPFHIMAIWERWRAAGSHR